MPLAMSGFFDSECEQNGGFQKSADSCYKIGTMHYDLEAAETNTFLNLTRARALA